MTSEQDINKVSLEVDGKIYDGWKSVVISSGIDQICRSFAVEITDNFPGNLEKFTRLRSGQSVVVKIGTDTVCTGYITSTPISYDAKSVTVQVQGKSKTVDLVDCCSPWAAIASSKEHTDTSNSDSWKDVDPGKNSVQTVSVSKKVSVSWHNQSTQKIIADLCAPYGITVKCQSDIGNKYTNFTVNPGETVVESINRLLVKDNLIVTDDAFGNLVITEPGKAGDCEDALVTGENVLSASANFDVSKIYSTYAVVGQHKGSDLDFGKQASQDKGIAIDQNVDRYRLLVIKDTGQSSVGMTKSRADFERSYRSAQFSESTHTIQGWRQSSKKLWEINKIVRLIDNILGFSSKKSQLIKQLSYNLSPSGTTCSITTIPPEGYSRGESNKNPKSQTEQKSSSSGSWADVK
ncbi:phage baseplate assembly protein [Turicimonas muris]|uniref:phage baseplate assembly protein n=1 Tax=Turicimonas muris TaxID=1796652 RepID=UPI001EC0B6DB|nr:hypothetical protein [Turicimonas muris]MBS4847106.1 hypothetical protein [Burkholderiales bacterium]